MPYTTADERKAALARGPETVGDLTFVLTVSALRFKQHQGKLRFVTIALVMGAFFCAALEFYRRVAVPYENTKMALNGDVYQ
jgi:hypothetical protein